MKAAVGLRVVRGPHWELSDQRGDGGEGFVGTLIEVGGTKGSKLAENKVWVQWDSGMRRDHRAGQYGKYYDLCVFDSSPAGVVHANYTCDGCFKSPILGTRWRCLECHDYDLCTGCYMADEHNKHHKFERIDSSDSEGIPVGKRFGATKIQAKGVFAGARVVRGFNWNGNNQDGGKGKEGVVLEVTEYEGVPHSGAVISWNCGGKNNYRLGYLGKVDIKCVTPGTGGHYYKDHLQRLGEVPQRKKGIPKTGKVKTSEDETLQGTRKLQVGDNVRVTLPVDVVKLLNDTDGGPGWNDDMKPYLGKLGKVERVGKTVVIKYDDGSTWGFHPDAVRKDEVLETAHRRKRAMAEDDCPKKNKAEAKAESKPETTPETPGTDSASNEDISLKPGLLVKVMDDEEIVKNIQESCGLMWSTEIAECVGKVGEIKSVRSNGVVELSMNGTSGTRTVRFNKVLLTTETAPVDPEEEDEARGIGIEEFRSFLRSGVSLEDLLGSEIQLRGGQLGELLGGSGSLTGGQLGELLGGSGFLTELLTDAVCGNDSAAIGENSKDGRMLGMSASEGNLQKVKDVLQRNPHLVDNRLLGLTPLHKASHSGHLEVIKCLLENNASMTLKDLQGYTALHHAAFGDYSGAAVRVLAKYGADLNENSNSFGRPPLELAVKKRNEAAARSLIQVGCDVNTQNAVGRVALHVAVDENLESMTEILLTAKGISLKKCDRRGINPFIMAVMKGSTSFVEAMMKRSRKIVTVPEEEHGMTALHFTALYNNVEITKLLLQSEFCDPDARNVSGLTPAELATAAGNVEIVELFRNPSIWSVTQEGKCSPEREQKSPSSANNNSSTSRKQRFLGAEGMVVEKLPTGDLKFQSAGMPKDVILNPASLEPPIPEEPRLIDVALGTNRNEEAEDAVTSQAFLLSCLSGTEVCYQPTYDLDDGQALFWAVISERNCKVKEFLDCNPTLVNHCWKGIPILHAACVAQSVELTSLFIEKGVEIDLKDKEGYTALHHAAMMNRTGELAELLLDAGASPCDQENKKNTAPLHLAVTRYNVNTFDRLIKEDECGINVQDVFGNTPVHEAVRFNRGEMLESLLSHPKVELLLTNKDGHTALHIAIIRSNSSFVLKLLHHTPMLATITVQDGVEMSPIHLACAQPDVAILDALVNVQKEEWPDIHRTNDEGLAPLVVANRNNNKAVIRRLLQLYDQEDNQKMQSESEEESAELSNAGNDFGSSQTRYSTEKPLGVGDVVRIRKNKEVVRLLQDRHRPFNESTTTVLGEIGQIMSIAPNEDIEVIVDDKSWTFSPFAVTCVSRAETQDEVSTNPDTSEGTEELPNTAEPRAEQQDSKNRAAATSDTRTLEEVLDSYPELANVESHDTTPLHQACLCGLPTIVAMLLDKGVDKDAEDSAGRSPLHIAAAHDKSGSTAAVLIRHGANTNSNGVPNKRSPLHVAVWRNNEAVAREIMAHDSTDVNQQDLQGDTPFHMAVREMKDVFLIIFTAFEKTQPLIRNNYSFNTLHQAVISGNTNAVEKLLQCYPNMVNEATEDGFTPLHLAATHNQYECAELLLRTADCKTDTRTENNETAFMLASASGFTALKELLREPGNETEYGAGIDEAVSPNFVEPLEIKNEKKLDEKAQGKKDKVINLEEWKERVEPREVTENDDGHDHDFNGDAHKGDVNVDENEVYVAAEDGRCSNSDGDDDSENSCKNKDGDIDNNNKEEEEEEVPDENEKVGDEEEKFRDEKEKVEEEEKKVMHEEKNAVDEEEYVEEEEKETVDEKAKVVDEEKEVVGEEEDVEEEGKETVDEKEKVVNEEKEVVDEEEDVEEEGRETVDEKEKVVNEEKEVVDEEEDVKEKGKVMVDEKEKVVDEENEVVDEEEDVEEEGRETVDEKEKVVNEEKEVVDEEEDVEEEGKVMVDEKEKVVDEENEVVDEEEDVEEEGKEMVDEKEKVVDEENEVVDEEEEAYDEGEEVMNEEGEVVDEEKEWGNSNMNQTSRDWNDSSDGVGSSDEGMYLTAGQNNPKDTSSSCESGDETSKLSKNDNRHASNYESEDEQGSQGKESLCLLCERRPSSIMFHPCEHKIVCKGCSRMIKYCFTCGTPVATTIEDGC